MITNDELISIRDRAIQPKSIEIINELLQLRAENARLREQMRWIPVSERLPEEGVPVLCGTTEFDYISLYTFCDCGNGNDKHWRNVSGIPYHFDSVTHWQPLPPKPSK